MLGEQLREAVVKNRTGPSCHDTETGRPASCKTAVTSTKDPTGQMTPLKSQQEVSRLAADAQHEPTQEKVQELIHHLSHLTVAEVRQIKRGLGIRASGRKAELVAKVAKLAAMRLTLAERYHREAVKLGHSPRDLEGMAAQAREVHNNFIETINRVQSDARKLYSAMNPGKVLTRSMSAFRGGDLASIPGFDSIARTLAGRYPEVLGDHGYTREGGFDEKQDEASQRLYDLLAAGKLPRMTIEGSYQTAVKELAKRPPQERTVAQRRPPAPHPFALTPGEEAPF
jgi:hypothetical protein